MVAPVLALAVLAGCGTSTATPSVTVVGDTVTATELAQLQPLLNPPYTTTYVIRSDGRIGEMSSLLSSSIDSKGTPDIAIVNLGTIDAIQSHGAGNPVASPLAPLVSAASGISCVVLTTVNVMTDRNTNDTVAVRINHEIKRLTHSDPTKYKIVDWNEFLATLPAPSVPTYLQSNGVVETSTGASWLAKSDLAAVRACGTTHQPTVIGPNGG
jgi:propanediol utilization protein